MKKPKKLLLVWGGIAVLALVIGGVGAARSEETPRRSQVIPEPDVVVRAYPSFARDIQPIFKEFCGQCHGSQEARAGLRLDSYAGAMKGTVYGSVVVPEKPAMSTLLALIKHESDPAIWMPFHKKQLSTNRIRNIENWIRYGAWNN